MTLDEGEIEYIRDLKKTMIENSKEYHKPYYKQENIDKVVNTEMEHFYAPFEKSNRLDNYDR